MHLLYLVRMSINVVSSCILGSELAVHPFTTTTGTTFAVGTQLLLEEVDRTFSNDNSMLVGFTISRRRSIVEVDYSIEAYKYC